MRLRFSCVIAKMRDRKKHFRHILLFYYRRMLFRQEKSTQSLWRRCINGSDASVKISFQNFVPIISTLKMRHVSGKQIEIDEEIKIKMHRSKQTDSRSNSNSIIHDRVKRLMFHRREEKRNYFPDNPIRPSRNF